MTVSRADRIHVLLALAAALVAWPAAAQSPPAAAPSAPPAAATAPVQGAPVPVTVQPPAAAPAAPQAPSADAAAPVGETIGRPLRAPGAPLYELSAWSMFLSADIVVKGVMISLLFASLVTWTIFFAKLAELSIAGRRLRAALARIGNARSLSEAEFALGDGNHMLSTLLVAAVHELRLSAGSLNDAGIKERAASHFSEIARAESAGVRRGMSVIATIGATAPFVGLFGTVWGIMNSFIGISKLQTTNLAVVAPGIAEALLATAFGLGAAIPAVMIYNYLSRLTRRYLELVNRASGAAGRLLSRDLDRADSRVMPRAAE